MGLRSLLLLCFAVGTIADEVPFWPHYPTRTVYLLDGTWDFGYAGQVDPLTVDPKNTPTPDKMAVPGAYDVAPPGILGRRGVAFYKTTVSTTGAPGLLYLAACSFYCRVFVDDQYIGEHRAGGYQPFWLAVPASHQKTRNLLVIVDNRFNKTLAPTHTGGDFWEYGGITRNVLWHERPAAVYMKQIETFTLDAHKSLMRLHVVLGNTSMARQTTHVNVSLSWDSGPQTRSMRLAVDSKKLRAVINQEAVPNGTLWSPKTPNLHTVTVNLWDSNGKIVDAITARFGIRQIGMKNKRITINGEEIKLHGVNRHTMWPDDGSALNLEQVKTDVALLKEVGANYVRGAHYPQDQRYLDLCDEQGIVMWEETLGPGVSLKDLLNPYWLHYQIEAVNEMIDASVNHPSIILHAFYNEGPSDDHRACPGYNASANAIRERMGAGYSPPAWYVTWASDHKTHDVCLGIADVISFNSYPAWYNRPGDLPYISKFWTEQIEWVEQHWPEKPFCISETGAGGVYEWMNKTDPKWSQKYEMEVVERDIKWALAEDRLSGLTIWQFNDIKANDGDTKKCGQCNYLPHPKSLDKPWTCAYIDVHCGRPGGENHKGQVDFWRRKKESFYKMKELYNAQLKKDGYFD